MRGGEQDEQRQNVVQVLGVVFQHQPWETSQPRASSSAAVRKGGPGDLKPDLGTRIGM